MTNVKERATQEDMQKKLADIKQAQEDMRLEQQDLKEHTLNRLDAIDEKIEWFLSKGQQGAHPLSDRMSQIEEHLEQQNATLTLIKDFLFVSKKSVLTCMRCFYLRMYFFRPEIPDIGHPD